MTKPLASLIPLLAKGLVPGAALASSLLSPPALAGPGDLDPSFGDVGRVGPLMDLDGPAWSIQSQSLVPAPVLDVDLDQLLR